MGALQVEHIAKYFDGTPALKNVSLSVRPGEIVGLIGHNGAGKSTLLKVFSGAHQPSHGTIRIDGEPITFASPADSLAHGVATVYQELSLLANLSVTSNIFLAREKRKGLRIDRKTMNAEAQEIVDQFNLEVDVERRLGSYSVAKRQLLEIAIATTRGARYLLLDEPTTALEGKQIDQLLEYLKETAQKQNLGIIIVNHKLDELFQICDRIVALVDGSVVVNKRVNEVSRDDVIALIAGDENEGRYGSVSDSGAEGGAGAQPVGAGSPQPAGPDQTSRPLAGAASTDSKQQAPLSSGKPPVASPNTASSQIALHVQHLQTSFHQDVSLTVREGEIVGLYGLIGSGRTEFLRTLIGLYPITSGNVQLYQERYRPRQVKEAISRGVVYVSEERKHDGIIAQLDSIVNVALPVVNNYSKAGWLNRKKMSAESLARLDQLGLRGNPYQPITSLSGGNQQKVLLARALIQQPRVLLLDEPTKGVDIGVKSEIHSMLRQMAHKEGLAVVVVSSEEEEILDVSDRVAVFVRGRTPYQPMKAAELSPARLRSLAWGKSDVSQSVNSS